MFAKGLCFYKLFCIFVLGALAGDIIETIYCKIISGQWQNRSSFIYGHFSVVWGLAFVIATIMFYNAQDYSMMTIFFPF
ncbi:MAG: hypothetical protein Q4B70_18200 [Lachnospiraceae bacterium]|nr:hypothetical protein [Lachnospiraceae bacterium]